MTLTKKHKILAGVLAVGLGALLMDRVVLSTDGTGPSRAAASAVDAPGAGAGAAGASGADATTSSPAAEAQALAAMVAAHRSDHGIADRLADYAQRRGLDAEKVRDGFRPSPRWVAPTASTSTANAARTLSSDPLQQFAQTHQLVAVMGSGAATGGGSSGGGVAIINGRTLRVGQVIDGFRLVEVRERAVLLEPTGTGSGRGERVELRLIAGP